LEDDKFGKELTLLLEHAADGKEGAVEAFFRRLLESKVYVPVQPGFEEAEMASGDVAVVGAVSAQDYGFVTIVHDGKECLPIFTEEDFVEQWAQRETAASAQEGVYFRFNSTAS
jgi:hypothetical protein